MGPEDEEKQSVLIRVGSEVSYTDKDGVSTKRATVRGIVVRVPALKLNDDQFITCPNTGEDQEGVDLALLHKTPGDFIVDVRVHGRAWNAALSWGNGHQILEYKEDDNNEEVS